MKSHVKLLLHRLYNESAFVRTEFFYWSSSFANLDMLIIIYLFTYSFIHFCSPPLHFILHGVNESCVNITIAHFHSL